jgi:hypothetical protein
MARKAKGGSNAKERPQEGPQAVAPREESENRLEGTGASSIATRAAPRGEWGAIAAYIRRKTVAFLSIR